MFRTPCLLSECSSCLRRFAPSSRRSEVEKARENRTKALKDAHKVAHDEIGAFRAAEEAKCRAGEKDLGQRGDTTKPKVH